jgi:predicted DCC family thiol-disulfide oxidoreductase YuxK
MHVSKPLLVYDGDCDFCRKWIARLRWATGERVDYAPYQEAAARFPQIPPERFKSAVQLIESDGRVSQAAEAVFRSLSYRPGQGWLLWLYQRVAPFAALSEWGYRLVARHRGRFSSLTR